MLLHRFDGRNRSWILALGLAHHEALGGFEHHHGFHGVELHLAGLLGTTLLPVDLTRDRRLQHRDAVVTQGFQREYRINRTVSQSLVGFLLATHADPLDGVISTDHTRQTHRTAEARHDAQLDFWQADFRTVCHHPQVGRQYHFHTAAQRNTVDNRQGWNGQIFDGVEDGIGTQNPFNDLLFRTGEVTTEFGDISTHDESVFGRRYQNTFHALIISNGGCGFLQLVQRVAVEFVDRFAFQVEFQLGDVTLDHAYLDGFTFVNHQQISQWMLAG